MSFRLALIVAALVAGGPFGSATADATVVDSATVEVAVSVEGPIGTSVVLHALDPGSDQRTVAMVESQSGRYSTRFESRPVDLVVVFEDLATGQESDPVRLTELGVAPELVGVIAPGAVTDEAESPLGWLALGLGLASLSALAFWALGGRSQPEEASSEPGEVESVD